MEGVRSATMLELIFGRVLFRDPARPIEILSLLGLAGWCIFLVSFPNLLAERESYRAFSALAPHVWALMFGFVALLQLATIVLRFSPRVKAEIRFAAMALSAGMWTVVAVAFWTSGIFSTAHWTYTSIALLCSLTGMYLGWAAKTS